jgi:hypothetical protein
MNITVRISNIIEMHDCEQYLRKKMSFHRNFFPNSRIEIDYIFLLEILENWAINICS